MSMIDKLSILGVRSFDNKKAEIIKFYSPLTLIVGHNGSGKTTIIECLRYATTGELPPNSGTGGAWIHDPKLAGENEVLAQVKVSFNSATGSRMVVSRNLQLTVKKTARSQRALEAALQMIKNGERTVISSRVAELDQIMPQYLGTSKAVLESVIFCHQEDSLWPMSTPLNLKKKFDEIFEALKYTKAVDNIKLIRKNQMAELEKAKIREQHAKIDKDKGARAEAKSQELSDEIDRLREEEKELRLKSKDAAEKATEAMNQALRFQITVGELQTKRIQAHAANENVGNLKTYMREMSDSDDELRTMLEQYEDRLAQNESEKGDLTNKYRSLAQSLEENREVLGRKQGELGGFQAQKDKYDEQIAQRKDLIKETARSYNIRGFDVDITDNLIRDFMERIGKMSRDQQSEFERARKETREETQQVQRSLDALNSRRSELTQAKTSADSFIHANDSKISRFQMELNKIDIDEGGKSVLESNLADLESKLGRSKDELEKNNWETKIQASESSLRTLDAEKERYDNEMLEASRNAQDSARLDLLHKDFKDKTQGLDTMIGAHGDRVGTVLGATWEPSNLERVYQDVLSEKDANIKEAEQQRDGVGRELDQVKYKVADAAASLEQKRQDLALNEKIVRDSIESDDYGPAQYLENLTRLETELETSKSDQTSFVAMKSYYQQCKDTLNSHNACRLCRRGFTSPSEKNKFLQKLDQYLTQAVEQAKDEYFEETESEFNKAKAARLNYDTWIRLQSEIPIIETDYNNLDTRVQALNDQLEQHDRIVKERADAKRDVESIFKTVQNITKYYTEITSIELQIKQLEAVQNTAGTSRGLEKIQSDQKLVTDQIRSATAVLQQLRADRERNRTIIGALELEVRDVRAQLSSAVHQLREKSNLFDQIEELKSQNSQRQDELKRGDEEIQSLQLQISQMQAKIDDIRSRGDERDRDLQHQISKLNDSISELRRADQDISAYIDRGGPQLLARTSKEIEQIREDIARVEGDQRDLTVKIKKLETDLANQGETKRAITDNLSYRENVKQLQLLEQEIRELESHNAEADAAHYEREGNRWQTERMRFKAEQATIVGKLKSKDDQLRDFLQEWETDYKDAEINYRKAHIQVVVTKAAIEDLGRYGGALDKAIMKYHSLKMEEINRIIDELWRSTYQGTDVDTIMIRSESETQKSNKSYNYRVVMVKQDAEMDMRGRCSAGQKVLASIIIRLALSECFGVRCGLIALDEPTTNLDRDNIRALAQSLSEIIRVRRQQTNFQLIVITHDEEFLRYMNCADFADYYYRVSRDSNQNSQVFRQNISAVV